MRKWMWLAVLFVLTGVGCASTSPKDEGDDHVRKDKYEPAISKYDEHLSQEPGDYEALFKRAAAYDQSGQSARALAAYSSIIKKFPNQAEPRLFRARLLFQEHEAISALRDVDRILSGMENVHANTRAMALGLKGEIYYKQGDYERSSEAFNQARSSSSDNEDFKGTDSYLAILINASRVQFALGKFRSSKTYLDEYMTRKKTNGKEISSEDRQFYSQVMMYNGNHRAAQRYSGEK